MSKFDFIPENKQVEGGHVEQKCLITMKIKELINKYAHCDCYHIGSEEYSELNNLSDDKYDGLIDGLGQLGYQISYNNLEDCYCVY